jgi:hypothetical protein
VQLDIVGNGPLHYEPREQPVYLLIDHRYVQLRLLRRPDGQTQIKRRGMGSRIPSAVLWHRAFFKTQSRRVWTPNPPQHSHPETLLANRPLRISVSCDGASVETVTNLSQSTGSMCLFKWSISPYVTVQSKKHYRRPISENAKLEQL